MKMFVIYDSASGKPKPAKPVAKSLVLSLPKKGNVLSPKKLQNDQSGPNKVMLSSVMLNVIKDSYYDLHRNIDTCKYRPPTAPFPQLHLLPKGI